MGETQELLKQSKKAAAVLNVFNRQKARSKWNDDKNGGGLLDRLKKKLDPTPTVEDWVRQKEATKWQVDRLKESAWFLADMDLEKAEEDYNAIVRKTESGQTPNYGGGITELRKFAVGLEQGRQRSAKREKQDGTQGTEAAQLYQDVAGLLYRAAGVVPSGVLSGWEGRMKTFGLAAIKEGTDADKLKDKNAQPVRTNRDGLATLRLSLVATGRSEGEWGVQLWTEKLDEAQAALDRFRLQIELSSGEAAEKAEEEAEAIAAMIVARQIEAALKRLGETGTFQLTTLPDGSAVRQKLAEVFKLGRTLSTTEDTTVPRDHLPESGQAPTSKRALLTIEVNKLRMYCSMSGGSPDPQKLPDELATPKLYRQAVALASDIQKELERLQSGEKQLPTAPNVWTPLRQQLEMGAKAAREALKTALGSPDVLLAEKFDETVPAAIKECEKLIEAGEKNGSQDTSAATLQIKVVEGLAEQITKKIAAAKGDTDIQREALREELVKCKQIVDTGQKEKVPKKYAEILQSWGGTLLMDIEALLNLVDTVSATALPGLRDQLDKTKQDAAKFGQMSSSGKKQSGDASPREFVENEQQAATIEKALKKLSAEADFKTSRAADFTELNKQLTTLKGRVRATEPGRLKEELAAFALTVKQYEDNERKKIAEARELLKDRFNWLAVIFKAAEDKKSPPNDARLAYLDSLKRKIQAFETALKQTLEVSAATQATVKDILSAVQSLGAGTWPDAKTLEGHENAAVAVEKVQSALTLFLDGELAAIQEGHPNWELAGQLRAAAKKGLETLRTDRDPKKAERLLLELRARLAQKPQANVSKRGDLSKMLEGLNKNWRETAQQFNGSVAALVKAVTAARKDEAEDVQKALDALSVRLSAVQNVFKPHVFNRAFDQLLAAPGEKEIARAREPILKVVRDLRSQIQSMPAFRLFRETPFEPKPDLQPVARTLNLIEKNVTFRH